MSLEDSFLRVGSGALIASVRDLRVALMTSVASMDLSFGDRYSSSCSWIFSFSAFFVRDDFPSGFVAFGFAVETEYFRAFELIGTLQFWGTPFGSKRSLRVVAVDGVQVDVEPTDARTTSAVACKEDILVGERLMYSY